MAKIRVLNYTFDASAQQITFTDYNPLRLDGLLIITNVTDNIIIYNFADATKGGTVATNVLTLIYDTTSMADGDKLLIYYDEDTQTTDLNVAINATQVSTLTPPAAITGFATSAKQLADGHNVEASQITAADLNCTEASASAIKTAVEALDNSVDGNYLNVNLNLAGTDAPSGAGTEAGVLRVTLPTDGTGKVTVVSGTAANLKCEEASAADIKTAVQVIDNFISGSRGLVTEDNSGSIKTAVEAINTKLVTGTVIGDVNLGATDNAVLDTIDTAIDAINTKLVTGTDIGDVTINNSTGAAAVNIQDGGNAITVDGTVAVTGVATETTLGTVHGHVDSIDGKITACNTGAVVLTTGSAAIGKLAANSGIDIGDVDVTSLPALAAGTNAIGKLLPPDIDITAHTNYARKYYTSAGAVTDGIVWSPAAGKRWHITSLYFQVSADATVTFEDDKAGGDDPVLKGEYKAGSGHALTYDEKYPLASGEDAADLIVTTSAGNIYVTIIGYEI